MFAVAFVVAAFVLSGLYAWQAVEHAPPGRRVAVAKQVAFAVAWAALAALHLAQL